MNRYVRFKDPVLELDFWLLAIFSEEELFRWYNNYISENFEKIAKFDRSKHPNDEISFLLEMRDKIYGVDEGNVFDYLKKVMLIPKISTLKKYNAIYIHKNGSYIFEPEKLYTKVEEVFLEGYKFPESQMITISTWNGGKHFYVGNRKFDTYEDAERYAKKLGAKNVMFKKVDW
jgi:hypothetical protein